MFRAIAPLEAVIQSAGRCNREGKLGTLGGRVFLFKLQDGGIPDKTYAVCAGDAEELIKRDIDQLHGHTIFNEYYAQVIRLYKEFLSMDDYRKMQAYTVQVYEHFIFQNSQMCKIMDQWFMVWYGNYDPQTGISVAPIEADKLVV